MALEALTQPARGRQREDVLALLCVRDELPLLAHWLSYHRALGIDEFIIVDNGSTDGTSEFLRIQPDVRLYWTTDSYAGSRCGIDWINGLLDDHACGHWALVLDADELFLFPGCETIGLADLVAYLDLHQVDSLGGVMIDMYSDRPIAETPLHGKSGFLQLCPFFDGDGYEFLEPGASLGPEHFRGGPRERVFWAHRERELPPPYLGKVPLVKWRTGRAYQASTHLIPSDHLADETCVLLHFKFFASFLEAVPLEVQRQQHWNSASQYKAYLEVVEQDRSLNLFYPGSVRYAGTSQLIERGFMRSSPSLDRRIEGQGGAGSS